MSLNRHLDRLQLLPEQEKGNRFELLAKWWLENSPLFQRLGDPVVQVWPWKEWADNWGPDRGIDLVARTRAGQLWAIQAKAYSQTNSITKRDIDSFLSESARSLFSRRILVSTTDRISAGAIGVIEGQEKPVERFMLSDLKAEDLDWPLRLRASRPRKKRPRRHQQEALKAISQGLKKHDRGQAIMSCGTGKTLVGMWAAEKLGARRRSQQ